MTRSSMNNNSVKIVAIVCGTAIAIFLLYQFMFSPYARCVNTHKELKSYDILGKSSVIKDRDDLMAKLKSECAIKAR